MNFLRSVRSHIWPKVNGLGSRGQVEITDIAKMHFWQ